MVRFGNQMQDTWCSILVMIGLTGLTRGIRILALNVFQSLYYIWCRLLMVAVCPFCMFILYIHYITLHTTFLFSIIVMLTPRLLEDYEKCGMVLDSLV